MIHYENALHDDLDRVYQIQVARYLPEEIRVGIERNYYALVQDQARFERFVDDPAFRKDPGGHIALFSDHGPVHVQDVAKQILHVLDTVHGVLIPKRSAYRLEFMRGYGVILAYLHDIGMMSGRKMHPEFATQEVYTEAFADWIETIWHENCGNIAWRLRELADQGALKQDPKTTLMELISMANCHSKSKVAIEVLNDTQALRQRMQITLGMDLACLHAKQRVEEARAKLSKARLPVADPAAIHVLENRLQQAESALEAYPHPPTIASAPNLVAQRRYENFERDAYGWLVSENEAMRVLVSDVVDTLRALRAADALRQRGTVFKTSAAYPIFIDRTNAGAIYALEKKSGQKFLLSLDKALHVGEANVASTEITPHGDMRISFHRGAFADAEAVRRAAYAAALIVQDVQSDIIESFERPAAEEGAADRPAKTAAEMRILLESVDDNMDFTELVYQELERSYPGLANRCQTVPSLHNVEPRERSRYLHAAHLALSPDERSKILANIAEQGHKTNDIDPLHAFDDVKRIRLRAGEILVHGGAPPGFVYIPLSAGLKGTPLGGYDAFHVFAWVPLGDAGVIRGAARNATVTAECELDVLAIPKEVYFRHWHRTHSLAEFTEALCQAAPEDEQAEPE